jgi:hypothetical protein
MSHPLLNKTILWSHDTSRLVGRATHYDADDDELFVIVDGITHAHIWVPATSCVEVIV